MHAQPLVQLPDSLRKQPPDQYTRNWWVSQILHYLNLHHSRILDVGSCRGQLHAFLPAARVVGLDLRSGPDVSVRANATRLPFPDQAFEAACCMDTIEHLPSGARDHAIRELLRVCSGPILIAAPFKTPLVERAESHLQSFHAYLTRGVLHAWLQEHQAFGLPTHGWVEGILGEHGLSHYRIPSNYLPNWLLFQLMLFLNVYEVGQPLEHFFDTYNQHFLALGDANEPAYRSMYIASRDHKLLHEIESFFGSLKDSSVNFETGTEETLACWFAILQPAFTTIAQILCPSAESEAQKQQAFEQTLDHIHGELAHLRTALELVHTERLSLRRETQHLRRRMGRLAHRLQQAYQHNDAFERALHETTHRKEMAERRTHNLAASLERQGRRLNRMTARMANLQRKSRQIQEERDTARRTAQRHETFIHHQHEQLQALRVELAGIFNSRTWRLTAPIRRTLDIVKTATDFARLMPNLPLKSAWRVLYRRGPKVAYCIGKDYVRTLVHNIKHPSTRPILKSVVFLSGCAGDSRRYRCDYQVEQLAMLGVTADVAFHGAIDLGEVLTRYGCLILHRVPYGPDIERLIREAHRGNKPLLFDSDDWVFDPKAARHVAALSRMNDDERRLYQEGLVRYHQTFTNCDGALVSTDRLKGLAMDVHPNVSTAYNVVSQEMIHLAESALQKRQSKSETQGALVIAYLSGTPTHDRDFLEAADAVLWALTTYREVHFQAVGHLTLDSRFDQFSTRVRRLPLMPWQRLPDVLARAHINLAPLEQDNPFTDSKSCLKYLEAGLCKVPTIASPRSDFVRVIEDGKNGLLAESPEEWKAKLRQLIESEPLRNKMGEQAYQDVHMNHTSMARATTFYETLHKVSCTARNPHAPKTLTINWIVRAPIAQTGGGYRTIFRLADALATNGHQVRMYVEPIAHLEGMSPNQIDAFLDKHFGPLQFEPIVGHEHILPADVSIATNWPTAHTVANHPSSLMKCYFIQDFEPEFYETTDPLYQEAARTYDLPLGHICIGRYLQQRLSQFTGKPAERIDFAVDTETFKVHIPPAERKDPVIVLFFARPGLTRRGFELGVEALRLINRQWPDVRIRLFGAEAEDLGSLPFPCEPLGILDAPALVNAMNQAHILVSFSLSNISWVPYEGMACGCAVVEANVPSVAEMVSPHVNCVLADPTPESVAKAVTSLIENPAFRIRLGEQAADDMKQQSWARSAAQFEALLQQRCLARLRPPSPHPQGVSILSHTEHGMCSIHREF